jgi:hypothetical protein
LEDDLSPADRAAVVPVRLDAQDQEAPSPPGARALVWIARADEPESDELTAALAELDLNDPRPVMVLVGGAANLAEPVKAQLLRLFEALTPQLDALGVTVVDGGTAFGVMATMGQARKGTGARFPLLGIAPRGAVAVDMRLPHSKDDDDQGVSDLSSVDDKTRLDANHTHFLLVPGDRWGDESPWISAAADHLARGRATLMLVAAGGEITQLDVMHRLRTGGRVLVLAGSGGAADRLASWSREDRTNPGFDASETERALIEVLDLADAPEQLPQILSRAFEP